MTPSPSPEWRFDDHASSLRSMRSGFLAAVWWRTADRPDGRVVLHAGGWCQGVGSFDVLWVTCASRQACLELFVRSARGMLTALPPTPLARVQRVARDDLLARIGRVRARIIFRHSRTCAVGTLGSLPSAISGGF